MDVRIIVGSTHAYACISHESRDMDVQLIAGRPPEDSLIQIARDLREKANEMLLRASIMEEAAAYLAGQKR
jgi:hypothetical protein